MTNKRGKLPPADNVQDISGNGNDGLLLGCGEASGFEITDSELGLTLTLSEANSILAIAHELDVRTEGQDENLKNLDRFIKSVSMAVQAAGVMVDF